MLLDLALLTTLAGAAAAPRVPSHHVPAPAPFAMPRLAHTPGIRIWTSHDELYRRGERVRVYYRTERDAYVTILRVDTDGRIQVLFPRNPDDETLGYGGSTYTVSGDSRTEAFYVDDYNGVGYIFGVASTEPFNYDAFRNNGRWDLRSISDGRVHGDPRAALEESVSRLMPSGYSDYDTHLLPYYVEQRYDYPRFVCYDCHAYTPYAYWDPYSNWCRRFTMVVYNDPFYFYPSYWYPTQYYGGTRVVYTSGSAGQRYVFRTRENSAPGVDYRDRRQSDALAARRPEERGVRGFDIGGVGSVATPRQGDRRGASAGGGGNESPRSGEDGIDGRRRASGSSAPGSTGTPARADQGGRRRVDAAPGIEIVPRTGQPVLRPADEARPRDPSRERGADPSRQRPETISRPQSDEPRPSRQNAPAREPTRETQDRRPEAQPSGAPERRPEARPEPKRDASPPRESGPPPRQASPPRESSPPPRQASPPRQSSPPPQASPKLERRRP